MTKKVAMPYITDKEHSKDMAVIGATADRRKGDKDRKTEKFWQVH